MLRCITVILWVQLFVAFADNINTEFWEELITFLQLQSHYLIQV
jgi:hypothetical protein